MQLYLHVNTQKRRLVESAGSNSPKDMPALFREDTVRIHLWLANETGDFTNPLSEIGNLHSIAVEAAIGLPDQPPEALVTNWGQVAAYDQSFADYLSANGLTYVDGMYVPPGMQSKVLQADLNLNTTEMVNAFANAAGDTLERVFEIEVTDGGRRHTVLQVPVTLHKDIITHPNQAPSAVTAGSAFANSFAATATDSDTIEWQQTGDYNAAHIKGLNGATLTAGQHLAVNSTADGFELVTAPTGGGGGASAIDDLTDVDTSSAGHTPTDGQSLVWDASMGHWMPQTITGGSGGASAIDDLTDVDTTTSSPTTGQILTWDGTNWTPSAAPSGGGGGTSSVIAPFAYAAMTDTGTPGTGTGCTWTWDSASSTFTVLFDTARETNNYTVVTDEEFADTGSRYMMVLNKNPSGFDVQMYGGYGPSGDPKTVLVFDENPTIDVGAGATGPAGAAGQGWTGGTYDSSTGVVTFTSNDGLGFATGDLRGSGGGTTSTPTSVNYSSTEIQTGYWQMDFDVAMAGASFQRVDEINGAISIGLDSIVAGASVSLILRSVMEDTETNDPQITFPILWPNDWDWLSLRPDAIGLAQTMVIAISCTDSTTGGVIAGAAPVHIGTDMNPVLALNIDETTVNLP